MPEGEADSRVGQPRAKVLPLPQAAVPDQDYLVWAYQTHVTAIYQYVYSRVGNRPDAEDLTSQVFMKAIQGMRADVSVPELRSWLYKVAQTTLADHWRQYYAEDLTDLVLAEPGKPGGNPAGRRPARLLAGYIPARARAPLSAWLFGEGDSA